LSLAGKGDKALGFPVDVHNFVKEQRHDHAATYRLLSKK
jgi:hypothetical protein